MTVPHEFLKAASMTPIASRPHRLLRAIAGPATMSFFAALLAMPAPAVAADESAYPTRPIRIVVSTAAGGGIDTVARRVAAKLQEAWGQSVIVENRPGAGQVIGANFVAKSAPDGYTLLCISSTHTMTPGLMPKLPYDAVKVFAPVTMLAYAPNILVVNPSLPARNLKEFVALAKAKQGKLNYGSAGTGSLGHLGMESLKSLTGMEIAHVPYKGAAPALNAVLAGEVSAEIVQIMSALPYVKAGKLRALGNTAAARSLAAPDIPTMAEAGVPGFNGSSWFGIVAPAKTPPAIVARLNREFVRIMNTPAMKAQFISEGAIPVADSPEEFAQKIQGEIASWTRLVKTMGITLEE
jgi:tripartite-type tricarboxylate transporter receptor subunit TctC